MTDPSRQVQRAEARSNDYWGKPDRLGVAHRSGKLRPCRRANAEGRERVSASVIAAATPRKRTNRKPLARIDFTPKWEGNKGRALNSVRNLARRLTGQDRAAREAAQ